VAIQAQIQVLLAVVEVGEEVVVSLWPNTGSNIEVAKL